ncbi:neprosin family prolyl endopeptidase [Boseaceae bacterium BT-24-1]|nr:neprosin family prolyl endopeptidase [Boseaceae bacterium BT-24-1]
MIDNGSITDFRRFIDEVASAKRDAVDAVGEATVADVEAFETMRRHVLGLYEGVEAQHTFMDHGGQIFDCIPVEQQPSLRGSDAKVAVPPALPPRRPDSGNGADSDVVIRSSLSPDRYDRYGNLAWCPNGTIPMRRVTLEELARFDSLQHYHHKAPLVSDDAPASLKVPPTSGKHCHAEGYQGIANLGGSSRHSIWRPACGKEQMSLSQCWYVGGVAEKMQTIEAGWMVQPSKFEGSRNPRLFIFFTPDNYIKGGYNLECPGFVQTGKLFALGGDLGKWVSKRDGTQYALELTWIRDRDERGDAWWLYVGGAEPGFALGYYPASLFEAGQLSQYSTYVAYGGETAAQKRWPQMGSGARADEGARKAASISRITVYDEHYHDWDADLLYTVTRGEQWYSVTGNVSHERGANIYFGGPGGAI